MDSTIAARRAAERWFLDRGLPSVITRRARLRAIWPRSAPAAGDGEHRYRASGTR
jgi:hypothetical protein